MVFIRLQIAVAAVTVNMEKAGLDDNSLNHAEKNMVWGRMYY